MKIIRNKEKLEAQVNELHNFEITNCKKSLNVLLGQQKQPLLDMVLGMMKLLKLYC